MTPSVSSQRIERGAYQRGAEAAPVRSYGEGSAYALEQEIARLKAQLEAAKSQTAGEIKSAYESGFNAGLSQGIEAGHSEVKPALELMNQLSLQVEEAMNQVWSDCRQAVTRLSLNIAEKIIGEAAMKQQDLALTMAIKCLKLLKDQATVTVQINPQDANLLREARAELAALTEGVRSVEVVERTHIGRGGVIIETNAGQLDARLEEQMATVIAMLDPGWSESGSEG